VSAAVHLDALARGAVDGTVSTFDTLWVPTEEISFHEIPRPAMPERKWPEALPWLLEDRVLAEPSSLAYRWGASHDPTRLVVATVARAALERWELLLGETYKAARLVPDALALPLEPQRWSVQVEGERCLVRTGTNSGFACTREWLRTLRAASGPLAEQARGALLLARDAGHAAEFGTARAYLPDWGQPAESGVAIDFASHRRGISRTAGSPMRVAALAAAAFAVAVLAWILLLGIETTALRDATRALAAGAPPASATSDAAVLLQRTARAMTRCPDCRAERLRLAGGTLELEVRDAAALLEALAADPVLIMQHESVAGDGRRQRIRLAAGGLR
jgi:type II secretory pathway component PulL